MTGRDPINWLAKLQKIPIPCKWIFKMALKSIKNPRYSLGFLYNCLNNSCLCWSDYLLFNGVEVFHVAWEVHVDCIAAVFHLD